MRRVATATSIRGFDRSHILVQMFPVTLQLLRCSVGRDSAWRRPRSMGPAPHGVKRTDLGSDRLGGPVEPASERWHGGEYYEGSEGLSNADGDGQASERQHQRRTCREA